MMALSQGLWRTAYIMRWMIIHHLSCCILQFLLSSCQVGSRSIYSRRFVITFRDGDALDQYTKYSAMHDDKGIMSHAEVDKWYGRRIVLRFDDHEMATMFRGQMYSVTSNMENILALEEDFVMAGSMLSPLSWAMDRDEPYGMSMYMNGLWNSGVGVVVASLDSGISRGMVDMFQSIKNGYDFVSDPSMSNDGDGRDEDWTDPGDAVPNLCNQSSWHGTMTGAMLACEPSRTGYAGVVPNATLIPVRVLGACGTGYASDVADAIVWTAGFEIRGLANKLDTQNVDVILMAFSGEGMCPSYLQSSIDLAISRNITLVASGGNNYNDTVANYFPGNCMGVYSVGSLDRKGRFAPYTNRDAILYFPGGSDEDADSSLTCMSHGKMLIPCSGTSFSAAYAAGWVASVIHQMGWFDVGAISGKYSSDYHDFSSIDAIYKVQAAHHSTAVCGALNHYWSPYSCCDCAGTTVTTFAWYDCPANSCTNPQWDEFCQCMPGFYALSESMRCSSYMGNPDGWPKAYDKIECVGCNGGYYCTGGVTSDFKHTRPAKWSDACLPGFYQTQGPSATQNRVCTVCPADAFCAGGLSPLQKCPYNWTTNNSTSQTSISHCSTCRKACASGQYCSPPSSLSQAGDGCITCPVGYSCPVGSKAPSACTMATYQDSTGRAECIPCKEGTASSTAAARTLPCSACSAGKFQPDPGKSQCIDCEPGKFQPEQGSISCRICVVGTYQPNMASTSCFGCPRGYGINSYVLGSSSDRSSIQFACTVCDPGKYSSPRTSNGGIVVSDCIPCPSGQYNPYERSMWCIQCPPYMTSPPGSNRSSQCSCPEENAFTDPATGNCVPCSKNCRQGFFMDNRECTAEIALNNIDSCTACSPCGYQQFMRMSNLCDGTQSYDTQSRTEACTTCIQMCENGQEMVYPCYSGNGTVDTTMCMSNYIYVKTLACNTGDSYLSPFTEYVATVPPTFQVLPNAMSNVFALMEPFVGVTVWESRNLDGAIAKKYEEFPPLMQYEQPSSAQGGQRIISSISWSLDGNVLYAVRMDATIVRMQVFPQKYRGIEASWSVISQYNQVEKPYSAQPNSPSLPSCVAVPQQPKSPDYEYVLRIQVELICTFDSGIKDERSAYIVRIMSDGSRLVDMQRHFSTYAAAGLLYDVSFNVIYWTVWNTWNSAYSHASEKKTIRRIYLDPRQVLLSYSGYVKCHF
jgi:hypothetical protein